MTKSKVKGTENAGKGLEKEQVEDGLGAAEERSEGQGENTRD